MASCSLLDRDRRTRPLINAESTAMTNMETTLTFTAKNVYGEMKFYPVNEQAKRLCEMIGQKTLTRTLKRDAEAMGFRFIETDRFGREIAILNIAA